MEIKGEFLCFADLQFPLDSFSFVFPNPPFFSFIYWLSFLIVADYSELWDCQDFWYSLQCILGFFVV